MKQIVSPRMTELTEIYDMLLDIHSALDKLEVKIKCLRIEERIKNADQRNNQSNKKGQS